MPLIQLMKSVRLTSLPFHMPRLSWSKSKIRHGRRLALLSRKSDPKSVYSLIGSVAGSFSSSSPNPNFPHCTSPRELKSVFGNYLRSHFSVSQPKASLRSRPRGYQSELCRATCPEESHSSFCSPLYPDEFLAAPQTSPRPLPLVQIKLPIPC